MVGGVLGEIAQMSGDQAEAAVVQQPVVQREGPGGADGAGVVDHLGLLGPGRVHRQQQRGDLLLGQGQRVAGVEDLAVDQEPDVEHLRDVRVDHRVPLAVDLDREAGRVEGVAVADPLHPALAEAGQPLGDGRVGPDPQRRVGLGGLPQPVLQEVVRVLVGDQHGVRPGHGLGLGEAAGVEDDGLPVLLQPHAGVSELGEPHGAGLSSQDGCFWRPPSCRSAEPPS